MWRTPYPGPQPGVDGPFPNGTIGLSGATAIAMIYLSDGSVVMAERPHGDFRLGQANPLLVNVRSLISPLNSNDDPDARVVTLADARLHASSGEYWDRRSGIAVLRIVLQQSACCRSKPPRHICAAGYEVRALLYAATLHYMSGLA